MIFYDFKLFKCFYNLPLNAQTPKTVDSFTPNRQKTKDIKRISTYYSKRLIVKLKMEKKRVMICLSEKDFNSFEIVRKGDGDRTKSSLVAKWIREAVQNVN